MSNSHTIRYGCGCAICMTPKPFFEFPGIEESERRQEAYAASRRAYAEANGLPFERQRIREG